MRSKRATIRLAHPRVASSSSSSSSSSVLCLCARVCVCVSRAAVMEPATVALITLLALGSLKLTAGGTLAYVYGEDALRWFGFTRIASGEGGGNDAVSTAVETEEKKET